MLKQSKNRKNLLLFMTGIALSPSYAQYEITKSTINSGGSTLQNGAYQISGSTAQVDASTQSENGAYTINGGLWHQNNDLIFKSGFE